LTDLDNETVESGVRMSAEEAAEALAQLRAERPDLWDAGRREGCWRGIDLLKPEILPWIFATACYDFRRAHGREPELARPQTTADHWFALKFFHDIPMSPANPADKLDCMHFIPGELLRRIGVPKRVWTSAEAKLPEDDAIPPGVYWLKKSNACHMQLRLNWPPAAEERAAIEERAGRWLARPYGRIWGEWWYDFCHPRLLLERDVTPLREGRPEIKIFLRDGTPKLLYAIRLHKGAPNEQAYFDAELNRLEGHSPDNLPLEEDLPETIGLMLEAAAVIGRNFRNCRIDFLNTRGPKPCFGEITICHNNARKALAPPELDALARRLLFE
jgi:hypothetical protein